MPGLLDAAECEALERRRSATSRERMLREIAALVAALPAPLVLLLEDLHWSDHATLDVVTTPAQRRDPVRLLLIGTYRPVEVSVSGHPLRKLHQDLSDRGRCHDMWLAPLTKRDIAAYLEARWPGLAGVPELHRLEGELHRLAGERTAAERSFRNAVEMARGQGARILRDCWRPSTKDSICPISWKPRRFCRASPGRCSDRECPSPDVRRGV